MGLGGNNETKEHIRKLLKKKKKPDEDDGVWARMINELTGNCLTQNMKLDLQTSLNKKNVRNGGVNNNMKVLAWANINSSN